MPVSLSVRHAREARYAAKMANAETLIPEGPYCYQHTGRTEERTFQGKQISVPTTIACPFHKLHGGKPSQRNGYCRLLKAGDWMKHPHGTMLLWDGVKECGINPGQD